MQIPQVCDLVSMIAKGHKHYKECGTPPNYCQIANCMNEGEEIADRTESVRKAVFLEGVGSQ